MSFVLMVVIFSKNTETGYGVVAYFSGYGPQSMENGRNLLIGAKVRLSELRTAFLVIAKIPIIERIEMS